MDDMLIEEALTENCIVDLVIGIWCGRQAFTLRGLELPEFCIPRLRSILHKRGCWDPLTFSVWKQILKGTLDISRHKPDTGLLRQVGTNHNFPAHS